VAIAAAVGPQDRFDGVLVWWIEFLGRERSPVRGPSFENGCTDRFEILIRCRR
jgi:hypothetical protein